MSAEHAEQFHTQLSTDPELRGSVMEASEKVLEIARERGLHFTRDELADVFKGKFQDSADDPDGDDPLTSIASERPAL